MTGGYDRYFSAFDAFRSGVVLIRGKWQIVFRTHGIPCVGKKTVADPSHKDSDKTRRDESSGCSYKFETDIRRLCLCRQKYVGELTHGFLWPPCFTYMLLTNRMGWNSIARYERRAAGMISEHHYRPSELSSFTVVGNWLGVPAVCMIPVWNRWCWLHLTIQKRGTYPSGSQRRPFDAGICFNLNIFTLSPLTGIAFSVVQVAISDW